MSFKLHYDVNTNKKECDPIKFYERFGGVTYKETLPKARRGVDYYFNPRKQVRAANQNVDNVDTIKRSFILKNYDHTKRPQCVDEQKIDGVHDGSVGFNRETVYGILNVDLVPIDVLEYSSEADKWRHKGQSNTEPEHAKEAAAMSEVSIQEHIKDGVREGFIVSDKEIREEIAAMSMTRDGHLLIDSEAKKRIFKNIKDNHPKYDKLQTWSNDIANIACEQLGLPYGGYNEDLGMVGYYVSHTAGKDTVWNSMIQNTEHIGLPVGLTLYLPTPPQSKKETIKKRNLILDSIPNAFDKLAIRNSSMFDMSISETRQKMIDNMKFQIFGFLNSFVDEVPENHPYDYCLVDVDGNYIKNPICSDIKPTSSWYSNTLEDFISE